MGGWRDVWPFRLTLLVLLGLTIFSAVQFADALMTGAALMRRGRHVALAAHPVLYGLAVLKWAVLPALMTFVLVRARRDGVGWERLKRLWQWGPD